MSIYRQKNVSPFAFFNPLVNESDAARQLNHTLDELTLVCLYLDLGDLIKGEGKGQMMYTRGSYIRWLLRLARVLNPLVFYTEVPVVRDIVVRERAGEDSVDPALLDTNITSYDFLASRLRESRTAGTADRRKSSSDRVDLSSRTRALVIKRSSLRSFSHYLPRIRELLKDPPYPRYSPNTVFPEYGATMHAKFDVLERAIRANYFGSKYFAWIDVGVFRELAVVGVAGGAGAANGPAPVVHYGLLLPPEFDERRVAFGQVLEPHFELTPEQIVAENKVWLCGCFFAAERDIMLRFGAQYAAAVEEMHARGLSSTDQQVFYSMYTNIGRSWRSGRAVEIQPFLRDDTHSSLNDWFFLAYICKEQWERFQSRLIS